MSEPALSVVVMGYRNAPMIVEAVASVLAQADDRVEVVVVTSGGDDSAARVRARFPDVPVHESATRLLPGGARNAGIAMTSGRAVAWLAADCLAAPGWVEGRLAAHAAGRPAVTGSVSDHGWPAPWSRAYHYLRFRLRLPGLPAATVGPQDPRCHGLSLTRSTIEHVGLFDDRLRIGEDTEMAHRLAAHDVPIRFEPTVTNVHRGPTSPWQLVHEEWRRTRLRHEHRQAAGIEMARPLLYLPWRRAFGAARHFGHDRQVAVWAAAPFMLLALLTRLVCWVWIRLGRRLA